MVPAELRKMVLDVLESMALGLSLWSADFRSGRPPRLLVYIDHPQGVRLEHCSRVTKQLSLVLKTGPEIFQNLLLEVSSPGINRTLLEPKHYVACLGKPIGIVLHTGPEKKKGILREVLDRGFFIEDEGERCFVLFTEIKKANVEEL